MSRIDARTGRLFPENSEDLSLAQAVEDALFTIPGVRRSRPYYGSYLTDFGRGVQEIVPTIYDALRHVDGIRKVDVVTGGGTLRVIINDAQIFDSAGIIIGGTLSWDGQDLTWNGESIDYGR